MHLLEEKGSGDTWYAEVARREGCGAWTPCSFRDAALRDPAWVLPDIQDPSRNHTMVPPS
jgi:hypothetical protein